MSPTRRTATKICRQNGDPCEPRLFFVALLATFANRDIVLSPIRRPLRTATLFYRRFGDRDICDGWVVADIGDRDIDLSPFRRPRQYGKIFCRRFGDLCEPRHYFIADSTLFCRWFGDFCEPRHYFVADSATFANRDNILSPIRRLLRTATLFYRRFGERDICDGWVSVFFILCETFSLP